MHHFHSTRSFRMVNTAHIGPKHANTALSAPFACQTSIAGVSEISIPSCLPGSGSGDSWTALRKDKAANLDTGDSHLWNSSRAGVAAPPNGFQRANYKPPNTLTGMIDCIRFHAESGFLPVAPKWPTAYLVVHFPAVGTPKGYPKESLTEVLFLVTLNSTN
jgi:hypothetical protein